MPSASKRKGSSFENDIAKFLNKTFATEQFARTPGSGAWMGRSNSAKRSGVAQEAQITLRGDLITPSNFPFMIECKNYNDSPVYHTIIKGPDSKLDGWLKEVEFDASQAKLLPMLWFKTTRKGVFVAVPRKTVEQYLDLYEYCCVYRDYVIISQESFETHQAQFWINPEA
jgi:hypothetical protein